MWAWLLFRISGLVLVFYLGAHIIVISTGQFDRASTRLMKTFDNPLFVLARPGAGGGGPLPRAERRAHHPHGLRDRHQAAQDHVLVRPWRSWSSASRSSPVVAFTFIATGSGGELVKAETVSTHEGGMWSWLFQRITAVLLIVCLAIHLILTHIVNIGELDYANIGDRLRPRRLHRGRHHPAGGRASSTL